jgi:predicted SAM-dependent methyltransferase
MKLDFGSGPWPNPLADIHVDRDGSFPHVDVVHNLIITPYPFGDGIADTIFLHDVIEHITVFNIRVVLKECYRILKPGGILDITCPDVSWIAERVVNNDWKDKAHGEWLNRYPTDFENAMSYLFGGFYTLGEFDKPGMGHVAGYNYAALSVLLGKCASWSLVERVVDDRNECILRVLATK